MKASQPHEIETVVKYTDVMLCREFWRTEQDILNMSSDFYETAVLILNKENAKKKAEALKNQNSAKR